MYINRVTVRSYSNKKSNVVFLIKQRFSRFNKYNDFFGPRTGRFAVRSNVKTITGVEGTRLDSISNIPNHGLPKDLINNNVLNSDSKFGCTQGIKHSSFFKSSLTDKLGLKKTSKELDIDSYKKWLTFNNSTTTVIDGLTGDVVILDNEEID